MTENIARLLLPFAAENSEREETKMRGGVIRWKSTKDCVEISGEEGGGGGVYGEGGIRICEAPLKWDSLFLEVGSTGGVRSKQIQKLPVCIEIGSGQGLCPQILT